MKSALYSCQILMKLELPW